MERAWRELSIDMAVDGPVLKFNEKQDRVPFYLHIKRGIVVPESDFF